MTTQDPLRYFRVEAAELIASLEAGLVSYETLPDSLPELFRLAHTLKGGARVVRLGTSADLAHAMEDVLAYHRDQGSVLSKQEVTELLQIVDAIRTALRDLPAAGPAERADLPSEPRTVEPEFDVVRVPLPEMDSIAAGILEAQSLAESLRAQVAALGDLGRTLRLGEHAAALSEQQQRLTSLSDLIDLELRRLSQQTGVLRLLNASAAFPELERAARDAAALTDKDVTLSARGGAVKIDGHVLSPLRGALLHLVRNAVAHGIEDRAARLAAGKPERGTVEVSVERRGGRIAFLVRDDGNGIDHDAVRRVAAERGISLTGKNGAPRTDELIFHPGLSTAREVSDLAGRGVGLDAVRSAVRRLKGQLNVSSEPGKGTTFEIVVPVSLSSIRALVIGVAGRTLLVPLDAVVATTRLAPSSLAVAGDGRALIHEGTALPFRQLSRWLDPHADASSGRIAVVLTTAHGQVAIAADSLHGTRDVTVRPLPRAAGKTSLVTGIAFDSQGDPELVLDPEGLLALSAEASGDDDAGAAIERRILVIDDSLTTRMLEQSILEAAGYQVDVASCAEEGLEKALQNRYGLIVCDVEMPGMNGYEFTKETRSRPELQAIPVIMVTSLASEESRRRGRDAGVSAYIVKGEFDQGGFLRTVGELLS
jgi:two-component system chemotaxis sensor kinase CheA